MQISSMDSLQRINRHEVDGFNYNLDLGSELNSNKSKDLNDQSGKWLLHTCVHCPKLNVAKTKSQSDQSSCIHASFITTLAMIYTAEAEGCEFLRRFVSLIEPLLRRRLDGFWKPCITRLEVNEIGVTLTAQDPLGHFKAETNWMMETGCFPRAVGLAPEPSSKHLHRAKPSAGTWEAIRLWLSECHTQHSCNKIEFTPLRLIHIHGRRNVILETLEKYVAYVALSYCWGGSQDCGTSISNLSERTSTGMAIEKLSKTLQDAIDVTRDLGLQYLWVDALCIVQDDPLDKYAQISAMPEIYKGAHVTIAASSARRSSEGFLETPKESHVLYRLSAQYLDQCSYITLSAKALFLPNMVDPLDTRAWALQERVLSPRYLDFRSRELRCECSLGTRILDSVETSNNDDIQPVSKSELNSRLTHGLLQQPKERVKITSIWHSMVEVYSRCELSRSEDKLPAISGLAKELGKSVDDRYLAGIWESALPRDLLWVCLSPRPRPCPDHAPSWTWASVNGEISYDISGVKQQKGEEMALTWGCRVTPMSDRDPYAMVHRQPSDGLCISGLMKPAQWVLNRKRLKDPVNGANLDANTFPDAIEDDWQDDPIDVYVLNFWQPTGVDRLNLGNRESRAAVAKLTPLGFILIPFGEPHDLYGDPGLRSLEHPIQRFKRIGLYRGGSSSSWFSNSDWKAIIVN